MSMSTRQVIRSTRRADARESGVSDNIRSKTTEDRERAVVSTHGLALMPDYAINLMPASVVSRPLAGEAPAIEVAVGCSASNTSPILQVFRSRLEDLIGSDHSVE
jgi:DNA-binding transcriptional LysR family regulator